ncbi:class I SAM-dependent methyltransferase [Cellulomonas fimi]|uniref:Methyltransferase type 11 n=1 Tax=Cellulomonas fimi (strain ATCC 484 / DSM 20113 / JCM 1341 / CCUG 24087 / LMG 16345 / NBRC 15513 / NCIMB 8980 / NCTC 7547 / NRS-133) TaxID=590998 RepID=F4H0E3_CELFA|nr:class I SAM-dependent methyltransferase [Cellulomonas fimi]AEE47312.1 Methyltransferase type 11 [Cellulomonas fimi ATCC 484]VEH35887.1 Malonyl-CoA O-methyltransferase BioC [Cellulomonas fimi]
MADDRLHGADADDERVRADDERVHADAERVRADAERVRAGDDHVAVGSGAGGADDAHVEAWDAMADGWTTLWAPMAAPAHALLADRAGVGPGTRALDVGCGGGQLLAVLAARGATVAGVDPAPRMVARARAAVPGADVRRGDAEHLPWPDAAFDVVVSLNALDLADDVPAALAEAVRVTVPGGLVALCGWAEAARNDVAVLASAVARHAGDGDGLPDQELRVPGGWERLLVAGGLGVEATGVVDVPWDLPDADTLVRALLLGADDDERDDTAPVVLAAARPFRTAAGGYRLRNAFRWAIGRRPA